MLPLHAVMSFLPVRSTPPNDPGVETATCQVPGAIDVTVFPVSSVIVNVQLIV